MYEHTWKLGCGRRRVAWIGSLLLGCCAALAAQPARGQTVAPPVASAQESAAPLSSPFYTALDTLSKRFGVAFVAEGMPFPQRENGRAPSLNADLAPDAAVQEVADCFDYAAVRQGSVYLLTKRYTNPEDMPDVTTEECRNGLKLAAKAFPGGTFESNFARTPEEALAKVIAPGSFASPTQEQWTRMTTVGVPLSDLSEFVQHTAWMTAYKFYYQTHQDRIAGTFAEMDDRPPVNPSFHWKTLDNSRAFGYDTILVDFIPLSDADRVVVPSYKAPLPRAGFFVRTDIHVPATDPTDPSTLSEAAKQYLDDNGRSSPVVTLSQAIDTLNRQAAVPSSYRVDPMYAAKHVTLVGTDTLSPEIVMQSLAAVYGLRVSRQNGATVLTAPIPFHPVAFSEVKRALLSAIPAPIFRAFRMRSAPVQSADAPPGSPDASARPITLDDYETHGVTIQNTVLRMFRYVAQPQIGPRNGTTRTLSGFGERARNLFALARMARTYTDLCGLADCPQPPYLVDLSVFPNHVTLYGSVAGNLNTGARVTLFLKYADPKTGATYGPVEFLSSVLPRAHP